MTAVNRASKVQVLLAALALAWSGACTTSDVGATADAGPTTDGGSTADGGATRDAGSNPDAHSALRLSPAIATLGRGQSLQLSAAVTGSLAGSRVTWTAEGSAAVSATGLVSQPASGALGETVVAACVGAGADTLCDSASILPGYVASELGRSCDPLNPCPDPFVCTSFVSSPSHGGSCSVSCLTTTGCAFGYGAAGEPFCPSSGAPRRCLVSCVSSLECPGALSCLDTDADGAPDTCVDFSQAGWPPVGQGSQCQTDGQCTVPSLACAKELGTCQPVTCAQSGERCAVSSPSDGTCTPMVGQPSLCVLAGTSTDSCSTVSTRPEAPSRCVPGLLCVPTEGAQGTCEAACQGASDCALSGEDCLVPFEQLPSLQTCRPRPGPEPTCLGAASLSLGFVYREAIGHWGQRVRRGELVDLNRDGRAELLLPVPGAGGGFQVFGAVPNGRALEVQGRGVSPALEQVRFGDVTGDGVKDVVGFDSAQAYVMADQHDGGFIVGQTVSLVAGVELATVADVNGDTVADLVVVSAVTNELVIRTALSTGGFADRIVEPLADGGVGHLLVEDCDGDGVKDIISIGPTVVSVWKCAPTGLGPRVDQYFDLGGPPASQLLADFDGDGRTDVGYRASSGGGYELRGLMALPGCGFALVTLPLSADPLADGRPLAVLDTDGDGLRDLLLAGRDLGLARLAGTGSGFAATPEAVLPDVQEGSAPPLRPPDLASFGTADVDGLAGPELVRVVGSTLEVIPLVDAARRPVSLSSAFRAGAAVGQADLNGDGVPDVASVYGVTLSQPGSLWQDATGLFGPGLPDGGQTSSIRALADLDGDGVMDLVAAVERGTASEHVAIATGSGVGTFAPSAISSCSGASTFRAVLDWDGLNGLDVLCEGPQGVVPFLNDGAGHLVEDEPIGLSAELPGLVGDFDGDGRQDVVFEIAGQSAVRSLAVIFADRSAFIDEPPGYSLKAATSSRCGATPALLAVDLDRDGADELVAALAGPAGDLLVVWRAGTQALEARRLPSRSGPLATISAGDLNADGSVDLVVATAPPEGREWSSPSVHVYFGDGLGALGPPHGLGVDTFDRGGLVVDLDSDGRMDLVFPRDPGTWAAIGWPNRCP